MDTMKKIANILNGFLIITLVSMTAQVYSQSGAKEYYELRVYELKGNRTVFDNYLSKALIPYLNKASVAHVGVFNEISKAEPFKVYVLIPYPSFESFGAITAAMQKDEGYLKASEEYNRVPVDQPSYWRYESSFMVAFDGLPTHVVPATGSRLFELRIYEGYSDDAVRRKVKMFNEGEFDIFKRTNLNSVFFGENVSGSTLPCLTYMISFKDMEERDASWKKFIDDPEWKRISKLPEYANTVSRIHKIFLEPTSYSQL